MAKKTEVLVTCICNLPLVQMMGYVGEDPREAKSKGVEPYKVWVCPNAKIQADGINGVVGHTKLPVIIYEQVKNLLNGWKSQEDTRY